LIDTRWHSIVHFDDDFDCHKVAQRCAFWRCFDWHKVTLWQSKTSSKCTMMCHLVSIKHCPYVQRSATLWQSNIVKMYNAMPPCVNQNILRMYNLVSPCLYVQHNGDFYLNRYELCNC
jgi:hypothetical protein